MDEINFSTEGKKSDRRIQKEEQMKKKALVKKFGPMRGIKKEYTHQEAKKSNPMSKKGG